MKGIIDINVWMFATAMVVCAVITLSFMHIKFIGVSKTMEEVSIKEDKYTMVYALGAAKLYAGTSLRYAAYQSCFDALKNPSSEKSEFSGKEYAVLKTENDFRAAFESGVKSSFATYLSKGYTFLSVYPVSFPEYSVGAKFSETGVLLNTNSAGRISITMDKDVENVLSEEIRLENDADIEENVATSCYSLFMKGLELKPKIGEKLNGVVKENLKDKNGDDFKGQYTYAYLGDAPDCKTIFREKTGETAEQARERIGNLVKENAAEIGPAVNNNPAFEVKTEMLRFDSEVKQTEETTDMEKKEKTCGFEYQHKAYALVTVTASGEKLPVWNGISVAFEPLRLVFYVSTS